MCEYCEKKKDIKSANFCGEAKAMILVSDKFNTLDVRGNERKFQLFRRLYRPSFYINYCPMCGKELGA